jgi:hypothetical protein
VAAHAAALIATCRPRPICHRKGDSIEADLSVRADTPTRRLTIEATYDL